VLRGDAAALQQLYSVNPPATVTTPAGKSTDVSAEIQFWSAMKAKGLSAVTFSDVREQALRNPSSGDDLRQTVFQTELTTCAKSEPRKLYVSVALVWQKQGAAWRIVSSQRNDPARLLQPLAPRKDLYRADANANAEIRAALFRAASGHKRVLLVFGGNWCYDCHVLDAAFHSAEIAPLLKPFEVVHVDIGEFDKNLDIARRYDMLAEQAVPAIAVLDSDGRLLYAQRKHEFSATRRLGPEDLIAFLQRWKP
jgi:hypothetical protein